MAAESIWLGMFQAETGSGNTASAESTRMRLVTGLPAMPYPTNKGQEKRCWTTDIEQQ
jgi:hypothetical protein